MPLFLSINLGYKSIASSTSEFQIDPTFQHSELNNSWHGWERLPTSYFHSFCHPIHLFDPISSSFYTSRNVWPMVVFNNLASRWNSSFQLLEDMASSILLIITPRLWPFSKALTAALCAFLCCFRRLYDCITDHRARFDICKDEEN